MPIGRRRGRPASALPWQRDRGLPLLVWAVAAMIYLAGLAAIGLLVVGRSEAAWRKQLAAAMTLEIPAGTSPARLATALALLKQTPGIAGATPLTAAAEARLLAPWLGSGADLDGLPLPQLIDLRVAAPGAVDLGALRDRLASVVPGATLDDHAQWLGRLRRAARRVEIVLAATVAAGLLAVAPTAMFAAGTAFAADLALVELAHRLGATDRTIAWPLTLRALRLGLAGGAIGGVGAILTVAMLGRIGGIMQAGLVSGVGLGDWRPWAILAAVALAAGAVAAMSARACLGRRLAAWP